MFLIWASRLKLVYADLCPRIVPRHTGLSDGSALSPPTILDLYRRCCTTNITALTLTVSYCDAAYTYGAGSMAFGQAGMLATLCMVESPMSDAECT